jgi:hypothetical protein
MMLEYADKEESQLMAEAFREALTSHYDNLAPTAYRDPVFKELKKGDLAELADWTSLNKNISEQPTVPQSIGRSALSSAATDHPDLPDIMTGSNFPRPVSSRQSQRSQRSQNNDDIADNDNQERNGEQVGSPSATKRKEKSSIPEWQRLLGWTYRKGWDSRPRMTVLDPVRVTQDINKWSRPLQVKRSRRPNLVGKAKAASFGSITKRIKPKQYGVDKSEKEVDRLKAVLVDLSRARTPGPRYVVDPQPTRQELSSLLRPSISRGSSLATGQSKTFGHKLPPVHRYEEGGGPMYNVQYAKSNSIISFNSSVGMELHGSIYEFPFNNPSPGPAIANTTEAYLRTSAVINAERAAFSPANSRPSSPDQSPINSRPTSRSKESSPVRSLSRQI